jgi:cellulose synthase/poly-beta-1,6-N-acetylglucosamine synthase-like glycosyltransferase
MSDQNQQQSILQQGDRQHGQPVSMMLMQRQIVSAQSMVGALAEAGRITRPVTQVLEAEGLASREDILQAQAQHYSAQVLRRDVTPPDPDLITLLPAAFCLTHGVLPWARVGQTLLLATARPESFDTLRHTLPPDLGPVVMGLTLESDIHAEIQSRHGAALAQRAETCVPAHESCRDLNKVSPKSLALATFCAGIALPLLAFYPQYFLLAGLLLALLSLLCGQLLKTAALIASRRLRPMRRVKLPANPPMVSMLVPLFREETIAPVLISRLNRLTYPKACLEVVLILEEDDHLTRNALYHTQLPPWMRTVVVPRGTVTTKPRALNYALNFTKGEIIGIYDAEDAPAADQLDRVVAHFDRAANHVGCVQGILDFYNPKSNWLSRCFSIEYARWFRVLLAGLSRLGFALPLGGTTLFVRREAIQAVRGWDAHNVTEDADLGFRLSQHGYKTDLIATVTREEANNRPWPWIKQRSRWLKGYALTWWVNTRRPKETLRHLGWKSFLGLQIMLLGTVLQFALAPLLWSFWLLIAGLAHPLEGTLPREALMLLTGLFLWGEALTIMIGIAAVARTPHEGLFLWVPTMFLYFPLGTIAIYKGLWEIVTKPFYWDKTTHGHSAPDSEAAELNHGE